MKKQISFFILAAALLAFPAHSFAAEWGGSPAVIDLKAEARDIIKETVTVRNEGSRTLRIYPVVRNLVKSGTESFADPSQANKDISLANWISFPRGGLTLEPGERKAIDFQIQVNLTAKAGIYHSFIAFPEGSDRASAESGADAAPFVTVNLEVKEVIKENISLKKFVSLKKFFTGREAQVSYELENTGNRTEVPRGDLLIYDSRGREVAVLPVNKEGASLAANASVTLGNTWRPSALGQYKALLSIAYGSEEAPRVQDTIFFWYLPWQKVAAAGGAFFMIVLGLMLYFGSAPRNESTSPPRRIVGHLKSAGIPHVVDLRHPRK